MSKYHLQHQLKVRNPIYYELYDAFGKFRAEKVCLALYKVSDFRATIENGIQR